jgi:hypothetical protein
MNMSNKMIEEYPVLERTKKIINPESNTSHDVFIHVDDKQRVTEATQKGRRVLVARYPDFYKIYFFKYIPAGHEHYPFGGIKVWNVTYDQFQSFYFDSVALHPNGGQYRFVGDEEKED